MKTLKERTLYNLQLGRRAKVVGTLFAVIALFTALFAATGPASDADVPATGVTTLATTPYQAVGTAPNTTPLTGLKNGDTVSIAISAPVVFGADARLCRTGLTISLQSQFNPSPAGNCLANPLPGGGTGPLIGQSFGPTNTGGTLNFVVGTGSDTGSHVGAGADITCDVSNPCDLWLKISVPTSVLASGQSYVHYGLTFSGQPGVPTVSAIAGNGLATVTATPSVNTGNSTLVSELVTASPGGATCTVTLPAAGCNVTGLTNFTTYTFTATTTNAAAFTSAPSAASAAVTPQPGAPAITGTNPGNAQVQVVWSAATPAPINYTVTSTPGALVCTTSALTCTVTGLTNGTSYTFVVTANYAGGTTSSLASGSITPTGQFVTQTFTVTRPAGALLIGENCSSITGLPAGGAGYNLGTVPQNCNVSFGTAVLNANATYYTATAPIDAIKVLDTRDTDLGWTVTGSMTPFTASSGSFAPCNFGLVPTAVGEGGPTGYTQSLTAGAAVAPNCTPATGGYGSSNVVAQANALGGFGYSDITGVASVQIPVSAPSGLYTAVLTFTLLTK